MFRFQIQERGQNFEGNRQNCILIIPKKLEFREKVRIGREKSEFRLKQNKVNTKNLRILRQNVWFVGKKKASFGAGNLNFK